jgi:hypothetical protein
VDIPPDGVPGTPVKILNKTTDLFCSGHTFLPDGRLFVTGGEITDGIGSADTNIFDWRDSSWQKVGSMKAGRWYPTNVTLPSGDVLTAGGQLDLIAGINPLPEVWNLSTGWRELTNALSTHVDLYPRMHVAPNGKVFMSGIWAYTQYLDTDGTGAWSDVAMHTWDMSRDYGSSVIYDDGKVLVMGGGDPPTPTAETINLYDAAPRWKWANPMKYARRQLNATILADGKVLVTGGTSTPGFNDATQAVLPAEMWDPKTGAWTTMASMKVPRLYHSTALLLPDGRVLSAGGGQPAPVGGVNNFNAEIYSPPYLFKGPRPTITSAPASVNYGEKFFVETPDATDVAKATWIRLSSVTHAFNMNQRVNHLGVAAASGGVNIVAPTDKNLTPPGHYMLFLINGRGVPSIAKIVQIQ